MPEVSESWILPLLLKLWRASDAGCPEKYHPLRSPFDSAQGRLRSVAATRREQSSRWLNDRPVFELCLNDLHGRLLSQSPIGAWQRTDCLTMYSRYIYQAKTYSDKKYIQRRISDC